MDVTKLLEFDHRHVEELFARIDEAEGEARTPLIEELATALKAHMQLEEEVFYPTVQPVVGEEMVVEGDTEHELARKSLADMLRLAPDEPGFGAAMEATKAGIAHHVKEEEGEMFPKVRADGTLLEKVATPFMAKRLELGLPVGSDALAAASTKDELLEEARKAGVEGASSMNKSELADALAEVMAGAS